MLQVSRELADGSHPYLVTPAQTAAVRTALGPDKIVAVEMGAVLTKDRETALRRAHAHLDIYNLSDCTPELSHGNFLLHCADPLPPLVNIGHRELLLPDEYVRRFYRATPLGRKALVVVRARLNELFDEVARKQRKKDRLAGTQK